MCDEGLVGGRLHFISAIVPASEPGVLIALGAYLGRGPDDDLQNDVLDEHAPSLN
jgi:hypothetical protein